MKNKLHNDKNYITPWPFNNIVPSPKTNSEAQNTKCFCFHQLVHPPPLPLLPLQNNHYQIHHQRKGKKHSVLILIHMTSTFSLSTSHTCYHHFYFSSQTLKCNIVFVCESILKSSGSLERGSLDLWFASRIEAFCGKLIERFSKLALTFTTKLLHCTVGHCLSHQMDSLDRASPYVSFESEIESSSWRPMKTFPIKSCQFKPTFFPLCCTDWTLSLWITWFSRVIDVVNPSWPIFQLWLAVEVTKMDIPETILSVQTKVPFFWCTDLTLSLWIYFDFSGWSLLWTLIEHIFQLWLSVPVKKDG